MVAVSSGVGRTCRIRGLLSSSRALASASVPCKGYKGLSQLFPAAERVTCDICGQDDGTEGDLKVLTILPTVGAPLVACMASI